MSFSNNICLGFILVALSGCGSSDTNASFEDTKQDNVGKKIFELNLVDQQISDQGGIAKILKSKNYCNLNVELLSSYGKEIYDFKFKNSELNRTNHYIYQYSNGIINYGTEDDDELQDLMAKPSKKTTNSNEMELVKKETVIGSQNKDLNQEFKYYINMIPIDVISKCK